MTGSTQRSQHSHWFTRFGVAFPCAVILLLSGCAERKVKVKTFPWSTFAYTRPLAPPPGETQIDEDDPLEDATLDIAPPPSGVAIARSVPARPRVPVGNSPQSDNGNSKPDVPQIAPQLTAAEASAAQQQTSQSLSVAERNIGSAEGKSLNATQQDLASKVRSFMAEARDAANTGDWTRARAAAKKAEVLSQELASSL
jgi:hypothetical protein